MVLAVFKIVLVLLIYYYLGLLLLLKATDRQTDSDRQGLPQLIPVINRPIMSSSGMLNLTQSMLTTAPSIAGMFDTITDLFLCTESQTHGASRTYNITTNYIHHLSLSFLQTSSEL